MKYIYILFLLSACTSAPPQLTEHNLHKDKTNSWISLCGFVNGYTCLVGSRVEENN